MVKYFGSKPPSQRQLRVGEQVRSLLAELILREHWHLDVKASTTHISLTEVRMSPDLKNATIFVVPLPGEDLQEIVEHLNEAVPFFKKHLGARLNLRNVPQLKFIPDHSVAYAQKIESLLKSEKVQKDLNAQDKS